MRSKRRRSKTAYEWVEGIFTGVVLLFMVATIYYLYQMLYVLGF